jgi:hypothetical protein
MRRPWLEDAGKPLDDRWTTLEDERRLLEDDRPRLQESGRRSRSNDRRRVVSTGKFPCAVLYCEYRGDAVVMAVMFAETTVPLQVGVPR